MNTPYDWITVALFAGIAWLFFRAALDDGLDDSALLRYLPPVVGCAFANHFGNQGHDALAITLIGGVVAYVWLVLQPFGDRS
jgi:hypothetical protein